MAPETRIKIGFGLCVVGLLIALLSLVPAIVPANQIPWPVFVGTMVYMPGSALVFFSSQGQARNRNYNLVRFVRLGFFAVIVILSIRIFMA